MTRQIHVGYRLNDAGIPVADRKEMQIEYTVDSWSPMPKGYVILRHENQEYYIQRAEFDRFPNAYVEEKK